MRTTIELSDECRAKLLELAARRGEKGFSKIIGDAVEMYFKTAVADEELRRHALRLRGSLNRKDAEELRATTATLRESWR